MAWMALGGTEQQLPKAVLNIVATTRVLGKARPGNKINPEGLAQHAGAGPRAVRPHAAGGSPATRRSWI